MNQDSCYVVPSSKSFEQTVEDLQRVVPANGFGVLYIHDLGGALRAKGVDFEEQCKVFEVCNPVQAGKVLASDMQLNMALPCRISVFTEKGQTKIGMISPERMLASLSNNYSLAAVAEEVEEKTKLMIS